MCFDELERTRAAADTVRHYVLRRSTLDPEFAEGFESGYETSKIGVLLRQARQRAGLT